MNSISTSNNNNLWITILKTIAIFAVLYLFLVSIGMIGSAFKGMGKGFAEQLMNSNAGPLIGLFIGILATSLIQSSSTTTSLVVGMVAAGTFGDETSMAVAAAVPYIMGANIGTSITNTIVSLGHITNKTEFRRAFSASIVHDFFNILAVVILLPIQMATGFLSKSAVWLAELFIGADTITFKSPVKIITKPTVEWFKHLFQKQELIDYNVVLLIVAFIFLFFSLKYLTKLIKSLVIERLEAFFDSHLFKTALRAMFFGFFITIMVQSSSITTSLVVPMAGAGILSLKQIFPYSLGANIGTTVTAILASLVSGTIAPVAVAFSHLLFNICGILIVWPITTIRNIPIHLSEWMAGKAVQNRIFPILYIVIVFFIVPLSLIILVR